MKLFLFGYMLLTLAFIYKVWESGQFMRKEDMYYLIFFPLKGTVEERYNKSKIKVFKIYYFVLVLLVSFLPFNAALYSYFFEKPVLL